MYLVCIDQQKSYVHLLYKGLGSLNKAIWPKIFDIMKTVKSSLKSIYNTVCDINFMFWWLRRCPMTAVSS